MSVIYQGTSDAVCPITLEELDALISPVAFVSLPQQPYECEPLVAWLAVHRSNPLTRQRIKWARSPLEAVAPLEGFLCSERQRAVAQFIEETLGELFNGFGNEQALTNRWTQVVLVVGGASIRKVQCRCMGCFLIDQLKYPSADLFFLMYFLYVGVYLLLFYCADSSVSVLFSCVCSVVFGFYECLHFNMFRAHWLRVAAAKACLSGFVYFAGGV